VIQEQIRWWCERCVLRKCCGKQLPPMLSLNDEGKFASHQPSTEEPPRSIARRVTRLCTLQCRDTGEPSLIYAKGWAVELANMRYSTPSCTPVLSHEHCAELCQQLLYRRETRPLGLARPLQATILAFAPWMLICLSLPATRDLGNSQFDDDDSMAMVIPDRQLSMVRCHHNNAPCLTALDAKKNRTDSPSRRKVALMSNTT